MACPQHQSLQILFYDDGSHFAFVYTILNYSSEYDSILVW